MENKKKRKKKRIRKLLNRDDLTNQEREFVESLKSFFNEYTHLTYNQTRGLYNLYFKYFINKNGEEKDERKNKSLSDYK